MKRVWKQQRTIVSVVCPTGRPGGDFLVAALLMLTWCRTRLRKCLPRRPAKPTAEESE